MCELLPEPGFPAEALSRSAAMKRLSLIALTLLMGVQLSACNTMQGLGQDIKKGGEAIERAADKAAS
jgi:predicted small secreted protein